MFYPILFEVYAFQVARDWNARDGKRGYVARFAVRTAFRARYQVHQVGAGVHQEYWSVLSSPSRGRDCMISTV